VFPVTGKLFNCGMPFTRRKLILNQKIGEKILTR